MVRSPQKMAEKLAKKLPSQLVERLAAAGARLSDLNLVGRPNRILLFINLPQDLDMLLPLAIRLHESPAHRVDVVVTDKAFEQSPRIGALLAAAGIEPTVINHKAAVAGLQPGLGNVQAVVTASESTANAHKGPHRLTQRANQKSIPTYTMQHGFENVGLTYFDAEYPVGKILFASKTFFTWVNVTDLPAETPTETRQKCVAVGCPKFVDAPGLNVQIPNHPPDNKLVVVFENLHWSRYSDAYRQQFLQDLEQTALACPNVTFLVKPHHTGLWLTQRYQGTVPVAANLIIADPKAPKWEVFTAPALIQVADVVITTPSTVAIDAVRARCPVAVVGYDLSLPNFEPLPVLRDRQDWQHICMRANRQDAALLQRVDKFAQTRLVPGDAVQKIVEQITVDSHR